MLRAWPHPSFILSLICIMLVGCESPPTAEVASGTTAVTAGSTPARRLRLDRATPGEFDLPADLNSARAAAQHVAMLPRITEPALAREVALHASLYRAAYETNVGDITRHFLLEPLRPDELPPLACSPREFRLRVLGRLAGLDVPIAWGPSLDGNPVTREVFPGTALLATRLRFTLDQRSADGNSVRGQLGDWTVDVGSSRQGFGAAWDGRNWSIQRDRVRLVR